MIRIAGELIAFFWYIRIVRNILSYVHLWHVKEYRSDRMLVHLKTKQGKMILFPARRLPPITPKTVCFVIFMLTVCSLGAWFLPFPLLVKMAAVDVSTFPLTFFFVIGISVPTSFYHSYVIKKAVAKLAFHAPMKVIGVTGSFGKTSTKEFLATILATKWKTLKTETSKNSPIGIAETIVSKLDTRDEAFVVEMGAYKPGEIKEMTDMVSPQVGIILAINAQHQDLFKTIHTTKQSKFELFQGLKGKRIAIVNLDREETRDLVGWAVKDGCRVWGYTLGARNRFLGVEKVFSISDVLSDKETIRFTLATGSMKHTIRARVRGEHFIGNIAAAVSGANALGMGLGQACEGACRITTPQRMLKIVRGKHCTIIDDSFNNSPDAAIAAITYARKYSGQKILIFQPMIELGSTTSQAHREVGAYAGKHFQHIILTNSNFSEPFIQGVVSVRKGKKVEILDPEMTFTYLQKHMQTGATILLKGKEAAFVLPYVRTL
jgi:UDP-N-acetylmuramoyl-tripeptide--D-alanyl-D-alanine ligase